MPDTRQIHWATREGNRNRSHQLDPLTVLRRKQQRKERIMGGLGSDRRVISRPFQLANASRNVIELAKQ